MCALHPPHPPPRLPRAWDRVGTRHAFISRLTPHTSPQRPLARSTAHHSPCWARGWSCRGWPGWRGAVARRTTCLKRGADSQASVQVPWEPARSQELGVGGLREAPSPAPARERGTEGPPLGPRAQNRALPTPRLCTRPQAPPGSSRRLSRIPGGGGPFQT